MSDKREHWVEIDKWLVLLGNGFGAMGCFEMQGPRLMHPRGEGPRSSGALPTCWICFCGPCDSAPSSLGIADQLPSSRNTELLSLAAPIYSVTT